MSLLAYTDLIHLINEGVVTNVGANAVNSTSIDLTLGDKILYEKPISKDGTLHTAYLKNREPLNMEGHDLRNNPFCLYPGEFILAHTEQVFYLPNHISAEYKLKSSMARIGLEHLNAGWCDAGWNGSVLTLELKNMTCNHIIVLEKGCPAGQIVFFSHATVPDDKAYGVRGRYNNDQTVKGIKE